MPCDGLHAIVHAIRHTVQVRTLLGYTKTFEDPSDYAHMAMPDKATKSETEFSEL